MTGDEMKLAFETLEISYWKDYLVSWYDKRNDQVANDNTAAVYSFTLTDATPLVLRVMPYNPRMYPNTCKKEQSIFKLRLKDASGNTLNSLYYYESYNGYIDLTSTPLAAGSYTVEFNPTWGSADVHDYGVIINAPVDIEIKDSNGQTSRLTSHDFSSKDLVAEVP